MFVVNISILNWVLWVCCGYGHEAEGIWSSVHYSLAVIWHMPLVVMKVYG